MADQTTPDIGNLLNIDPDQLAKLLAQFQPSEQDKQQARAQALMATGLGILGGHGGLGRAVSQGGLLGLGAYQDTMKNQMAMRQQAMQQAMEAINASRQMQAMQEGVKFLNAGSGQGQSQQGQSPAPMPQQMPAGPGMPPSMPQAGPQGAAPSMPSQGQPTLGGAPPWATPRSQMGMAMISGDFKKMADVAGEQMKMQIGPDGSLFRNGVPVGRMTPQGAIIYEGGDVSRPKFYANPKEADQAAAEAAGAITGAQEKAKAAQDIVTIQTPTGPIQDVRSAAVQRLGGGGVAPSGTGPEPRISLNMKDAPLSQIQAAIDDARKNATTRSGYGVAPNPVTQTAREALLKGGVGQIEKSFETAHDNVSKGLPSIYEAKAILDSGKVLTGAGASFKLEFGRWLSSAGMGGDNYVENTQAFMANQAKSVMNVIRSLGSGSGISDSDRRYAAQAMGGTLDANEASLRKILDIGERVMRRQVESHNEHVIKVTHASGNPDMADMYRVELPPPYQRQSPEQAGTAPSRKVIDFAALPR